MAVDRDARRELAAVIRGFLNDEIKSYDLADRSFGIRSKDKTVHWCASVLWGFYDDCRTHKVVLGKSEWDYIQRMLLVLEGGGEVRTGRMPALSRELNYLTVILIGMVVTIASLYVYQPTWLAFFAWLGLSVGTVAVDSSIRAKFTAYAHLDPFNSFGELYRLRRYCSGFHKQPYRDEIGKRHIRHPILETNVEDVVPFLKMLFAPIIVVRYLLFQSSLGTRVVFEDTERTEGK